MLRLYRAEGLLDLDSSRDEGRGILITSTESLKWNVVEDRNGNETEKDIQDV